MTHVLVKVGDLFDEVADAIICPANPWLNLSGGVNGEILLRNGQAIQNELHAHLRSIGKSAVEPGTVVVTSPGPFKATQLLHVVAIDPFYDSSAEVVRKAMLGVLIKAQQLGARTVAMPALATGYGRLSFAEFGAGLFEAVKEDWSPIERLTVVVRKPENAESLRRLFEPPR